MNSIMTNSNLSSISEFFKEYNNRKEEIMEILQDYYEPEIGLFKKGNKIHIKKKNRGKFTAWCGGNVTDECIRRGKNSSNPVIRKRATFAANARKWSH